MGGPPTTRDRVHGGLSYRARFSGIGIIVRRRSKTFVDSIHPKETVWTSEVASLDCRSAANVGTVAYQLNRVSKCCWRPG